MYLKLGHMFQTEFAMDTRHNPSYPTRLADFGETPPARFNEIDISSSSGAAAAVGRLCRAWHRAVRIYHEMTANPRDVFQENWSRWQ